MTSISLTFVIRSILAKDPLLNMFKNKYRSSTNIN